MPNMPDYDSCVYPSNLFIDILIKQPTKKMAKNPFSCVYPSNLFIDILIKQRTRALNG